MFFLDYKHSKPNTTTILLFSPLGHKQFEKFPTFWPYSDKKNHCKHIILSHISSQEVCTMFSCVYLYTPMLYSSYDNIHLKGITDMKSYWLAEPQHNFLLSYLSSCWVCEHVGTIQTTPDTACKPVLFKPGPIWQINKNLVNVRSKIVA